ncbi:uncharacterized protein LOC144422198 isoform X1 [Styela clava]
MDFLCILVISFGLLGITASQECDVDNRVDCGFVSITQDNCIERGCCFDNSTYGIPWCFNKRNLEEQCQRAWYSRVECGHYGINKDECEDISCCWDDAEKHGKWCFLPTPLDLPETCAIPGPERVRCGEQGAIVTKDECEEMKCCYDPSMSGAPSCFNQRRQQTEKCTIAAESRVDCGYFGINETQCLNKGCCYDDSTNGAFWCFNKRNILEECAVDSDTRVDCGYFGITKEQCINKACCWDDGIREKPWCFNKPTLEGNCGGIESEDREECGYLGIAKEECEEKSCCYDESVNNVPWCFKQK